MAICCYHGLRDDSDPTRHWLLVAQSVFRAQMEFLKRHYQCLPLDEAVGLLRAGELRRPTACVTFDDGYLSNRSLALPLLKALDIPATVYVATGLIGSGQTLWTTRLEVAFATGPSRQISLEAIGLPPAVIGGDEGRRAALLVTTRLKTMTPSARDAALEAIESQVDRPPIPDAFTFMNWSDVSALPHESEGLISIGAHTVSHPILSRLSDDDMLREINDSVSAVSAAVTSPARSFAYPNGRAIDFDERTCRAVRAAGCEAAVTTIEGLNDPRTDPFRLRRVLLGGSDDVDVFRLRLAGALPAARVH